MIKKQEKPELGAQRVKSDYFFERNMASERERKASLAMGLARKKKYK